MSINRVTITGNLTRDPDLRSTAGGMPVLGLGVIDCEYLRGEKDEPMTFEDEFDYCPWKD